MLNKFMKETPKLLDKKTCGQQNVEQTAEHYRINPIEVLDSFGEAAVYRTWDVCYENHVKWYYGKYSKLGQVLE